MTAYADLLTVMLDIDVMHGRVCRTCRFYHAGWYERGLPIRQFKPCARGYGPHNSSDTCPDWKEKPP